jgi:YfiH family protein
MSADGFAADWPAPATVRTWQTTRRGGVSSGAFASLNLGLHVGDQPEAVAANRALLARRLILPGEPRWLEQTHGNRILNLDRGETGSADGATTKVAGVVLAIMTADCLPVLLATRDGQQIGAAHAGWRGLADGVLRAAVQRFECEPAGIMAWLGPAIGPEAFEVGAEVRAAFVDRDAAAAAAFVPNPRGRWQADLCWLARHQLRQAGIESIHGGSSCTFADAERYFSHRREAPCGRMASLIWLAAPGR